MVSRGNNMSDLTTPSSKIQEPRKLSSKWVLWAHLPHDTDWTINSYKPIYTFTTIEDAIAITETLPDALIKNCMLFIMKDGIKPMWEDPQNKNGGCFSYKISNKIVCSAWKHLTYAIVGNTVSKKMSFVDDVTGITISPKKNFCIMKIWMKGISNQNPGLVTTKIDGVSEHGCLFKKHSPEY